MAGENNSSSVCCRREPSSGPIPSWQQFHLGNIGLCSYLDTVADESGLWMFRLLTRTRRYKAGLLVALAYLLCVLGPGLAYAIGGNQIAAPCFGNDHMMPVMHMHHDGHHQASQQHAADETANHRSHDHGDKASPGPCCAMICVSGLPASLAKDLTPSRPISICPPEAFQSVAGQGPARLYRPPIA
jgi:hypothetical protein